jgi:hypothetical protein
MLVFGDLGLAIMIFPMGVLLQLLGDLLRVCNSCRITSVWVVMNCS